MKSELSELHNYVTKVTNRIRAMDARIEALLLYIQAEDMQPGYLKTENMTDLERIFQSTDRI